MLTVTKRPLVGRWRLMSGLAVLALLSSPALSHAGDESEGEIEKELAVVAKQISSFLKRYDKNTVAVGQFTSPPQLNASAGPGIAKILADELIENGIDVKKLAELGVKGEYRLTLKGGPQGPQAQIRGEVEDLAGKRLFSFTRSVRGEATLAYLFGLTVNLPASESDGVRGELLVASVTMPQTRVKSTARFGRLRQPLRTRDPGQAGRRLRAEGPDRERRPRVRQGQPR